MKVKNNYFGFIILIIMGIFMLLHKSPYIHLSHDIINFAHIFIDILIEAVPFVILGSFVSGCIQIYVSENIIRKIVPKNIILAYFQMACIGLIMPVCECAIVPIARRLIKKGMPVGLGITLMLAVPIINPIVIFSTYCAFSNRISVVILRVLGGFICSIITGVISDILCRKQNILNSSAYVDHMCTCGCGYFEEEKGLFKIIKHTNCEFWHITGYLIYGALLSSLFQVFASKFNILKLGSGGILSILFMMILGFSLSLCSEADSFVGAGFLDSQGICGCVGFLLLGPMLDLKNLIILLGTFNKKFVLKLAIITTLSIFILCILFMFMGF